MVRQTNECDRHRIDLLIEGQLTDAEQTRAAQHLESCQTCRRHLEQSAGDDSWWQDARQMLAGSEDDPSPADLSATNVLANSWHPTSTDELGPVEFTLDFLDPSDNPAMIGRLGEYEILELIGRGGMGLVLKGYQRALNRYVAVKVLAPHFASSGAARKRFAREAQAAAAVVHPHVVAIHSVDAEARLPYLVMPYVAARSLQARIDRQGPLELKEILRIGKQAAEGLAAAHAQGLVHRDVKPANILLEDGVGRVLLTDFGLARAVDDATMTRSGVIAGTPQFMSPEQAYGQSIDHRADLFSLGSVLYTMCTGRPPFRAETTMGVLRRICDDTPRPVRDINSEIPAWLGALIERLLAKDPADRLSSAAELSELLEQCLAHLQQPNVPLPASLLLVPPQQPRPPQAARRMTARFAAVLVACLSMAVILPFLFNNVISPGPSPDDSASHSIEPASSDAFPESADWSDGIAERLHDISSDADVLESQAFQLWDTPTIPATYFDPSTDQSHVQ